METTSLYSIWAFTNLIACIAMVVVNGMANAIPLNGLGTGELSDFYPNLFVPAGLTFSIWGIIYLLLTGFCIYGLVSRFNSSINPQFLKIIGPWFFFSCIANICWIFSWHWKKVGLSLLFMLALLASLIIIYEKMGINTGENGKGLFFFAKLPFSIYLGWISIATIANAAALLVNFKWKGFGLSESVWTIIVILAAVLLTSIIIYRKHDAGFSLVVLWAFLGIILKRSSAADAPSVVLTAALGMAFILIFYAVKIFIIK